MTVDVASPYFTITVIATATVPRVVAGTRSPVRRDPKGRGLLIEPAADRVLKLTFEDNEDEQDILKITVDNRDLAFLDSPIWVKGNLIEFSFGYPGRRFGPRAHLIDSISGFQELEITALEYTSTMNKAQCRLFKNKTRLEVVQEVLVESAPQLKALGVTNVDIDVTSLRGPFEPASPGGATPFGSAADSGATPFGAGAGGGATPFGEAAASATPFGSGVGSGEGPRDWQQARQTDWQFIKRLAEKVNYEAYIEGDTFHFHPRRLSKKPARVYTWFGGQGNLMDFKVDSLRSTDLASEVLVKGIDPMERRMVTGSGSDSETTRDSLGKEGTLVIGRNSRTGELSARRVLTSPEATEDRVKMEADTHFKRAEQQSIEASAKIVGDPGLPAKSVIEIRNVSRLLSGKYYVKKHVHEFGESYTGTLTLIKNAAEKIPREDGQELDKSKSRENNQEPETNSQLAIVREPRTGQLIQERRTQ